MSVRAERSGRVTTVILDRPGVRNAVDGPTAAALRRVPGFRRRRQRRRGRALGSRRHVLRVRRPQGGRRARRQPASPDGDGPMGPTRMQLAKPVIAAISGYAVAGGLELAVWCDLRVAEEDAVLGVFCRRFGVPLIDGGTVRLPATHRPGPGPGPDPHRPPRAAARSAGDGPGRPGSPARPGQGGRRGPGPPTRRAPADLPAQRPGLGA